MGLLPVAQFATEEYELYFEDTWQATDKLTLNLGLRWSLNTPVNETSGYEVAPTLPLGEFFDLRVKGMKAGIPYNDPISVDLAGPYYGRKGWYDTDWNNFQPRISFAYTPSFEDGILRKIFGANGESVIRGGFSMMYDRVGSAMAVNWDLNNTLGFVYSSNIGPNTFNGTDRPGPLFTGFDQNIRDLPRMDLTDSVSFPLSRPEDDSLQIEQSLDSTITTPVNYNWNLIGWPGFAGRNVFRSLLHWP